MIRRALLAFAVLASLAPAFAQAPPPVPALPDTERRTSYSVSATTCACSVGFALYGDSTDYQSWVEVYLNGALVTYNDPAFGWAITSPTGPLATIPRPITDAVLTFNSPQTGTVQIAGARRPRRSILFPENRGVAARDLNQGLNDIYAQNRETWDKINDVTGRSLLSQPGNSLGLLPLPAACANQYLAFDSGGLNPICRPGTLLPPADITAATLTLSGLAQFNGAAKITNGGSAGVGLLDILDNGTIGATSTDFVFRIREFESFNIPSGTFTPVRIAVQRDNGGIGNREATIIGQFGGNAISTEFMTGGEAIAQATAGMTHNSGIWTGWNPFCSLPSGMDSSSTCVGEESDVSVSSSIAKKVGVSAVDIDSTQGGSLIDAAFQAYKGAAAVGFQQAWLAGDDVNPARFPVKAGGYVLRAAPSAVNLNAAIDFFGLSGTFVEDTIKLRAGNQSIGFWSGGSASGGRIASTTTSGGGAIFFTAGDTILQAAGGINVLHSTANGVESLRFIDRAGTPAITPCGTAPSISGTNAGGVFTTGTGAPTACTVTFATVLATAGWPTNAWCAVAPDSANAAAIVGGWYISAISNTGFTVTLGTGTSSASFQYNCHGN